MQTTYDQPSKKRCLTQRSHGRPVGTTSRRPRVAAGPGEHWAEHNGITRGVLQEGQQHFGSAQQATDWLRKQSEYYPTAYRDDGLVVSFGKVLPRRQLNVEVWQILIHGAKPEKLPGSDNSKINVTNADTQ